ncbi:hypothetical protein AVEN_244934-1 [Araneus ventricosus]|uniref:Uncharacterized protein n=1 Tax=Araneus ventricosus TaxID=182803 RepID=A0A4Y2F7N2_ARAVE|nr:hypothetical protein AVEN_244934-1 [Araneus ventricosus]
MVWRKVTYLFPYILGGLRVVPSGKVSLGPEGSRLETDSTQDPPCMTCCTLNHTQYKRPSCVGAAVKTDNGPAYLRRQVPVETSGESAHPRGVVRGCERCQLRRRPCHLTGGSKLRGPSQIAPRSCSSKRNVTAS